MVCRRAVSVLADADLEMWIGRSCGLSPPDLSAASPSRRLCRSAVSVLADADLEMWIGPSCGLSPPDLSAASPSRRLWQASGGMARCARCGGDVEKRFLFCPWCAQPQRRKIVEFFRPHPRDAGKALRVTRYLTEDPHVRFSVWNESGVAESAVSLDEREARRVANFIRPIE